MEQVEVDWMPHCDDGSLPADSALVEWTTALLNAMDQYGRSMRVEPEKTRRQLESAGFTHIRQETVTVCYCPWTKDAHQRKVARWFNAGLRDGLRAMSYAPLIKIAGKSREEVEILCDRMFKDMCTLRYHSYCRM